MTEKNNSDLVDTLKHNTMKVQTKYYRTSRGKYYAISQTEKFLTKGHEFAVTVSFGNGEVSIQKETAYDAILSHAGEITQQEFEDAYREAFEAISKRFHALTNLSTEKL